MNRADQLVKEINAYLDRLAAADQPWRPAWIAAAICDDHAAGLAGAEQAEFWRHWALAAVRDQVRRCINKRTAADNDDAAPRLPGFEHLQAYYSVKRDEEEIGVPTADLTDQEIDEKVALLRSMGSTCFAHANELEQFKRDRVAQPAAA